MSDKRSFAGRGPSGCALMRAESLSKARRKVSRGQYPSSVAALVVLYVVWAPGLLENGFLLCTH